MIRTLRVSLENGFRAYALMRSFKLKTTTCHGCPGRRAADAFGSCRRRQLSQEALTRMHFSCRNIVSGAACNRCLPSLILVYGGKYRPMEYVLPVHRVELAAATRHFRLGRSSRGAQYVGHNQCSATPDSAHRLSVVCDRGSKIPSSAVWNTLVRAAF